MTESVRDILAAHGVTDVIDVEWTASEIDRTYLIQTPSTRAVVKESPIGSDAARMQAAMLALVAERAPHMPSPRLILNATTGLAITETETGTAFVTTFSSGIPLENTVITESLVDAIADAQATLLDVFRGIDAASLYVPDHNDWSIDSVTDYAHLIDDVAAVEHRAALRGIVADFLSQVAPVRSELPTQVIHADFNLSNLLVENGRITGIIDFGDAIVAPRVYDVAVTACYLALSLGELDHPLVARYLAAVSTMSGLTDAETAIVRTLMLARLAIVVLLSRDAARRDPSRASYVLRYDDLAVRLMDAICATGTTTTERSA
jgi:Ser/Thr protein kinase RdoA (MazF antagonist)